MLALESASVSFSVFTVSVTESAEWLERPLSSKKSKVELWTKRAPQSVNKV